MKQIQHFFGRWESDFKDKVKGCFSSWKDLIKGVPQGSGLCHLIYNINWNDLFFLIKDEDVCNLGDGTISWSDNKYVKLNTDKWHLLILGFKHEIMWAKIAKGIRWEKSNVKLLVITIDKNLGYDEHVSKLCSKSNRKLSTLFRCRDSFF